MKANRWSQCSVAIGFWVFLCCSCGPRGDLDLPLPPSSLDTLDSAVRAQYSDLRLGLEMVMDRRDSPEGEKAEAIGALGQWYFAHKFYNGAESAFGTARNLAPDQPRWPYYLAHIARESGDSGTAKSLFQEVINLETESVAARVWLSEIEFEDDRVDVAEQGFKSALAVRPNCVRALAGLAKTKKARGEYQASIKLFRRALAIQPNATTVRYGLAGAYRLAGDPQRARDELTRIPVDNRDQVAASLEDPWMREIEELLFGYSHYQRLGRKALDEGRNLEAVEHYRNAVTQRPFATTARINLALALSRAGQKEAAQHEAMTAVENEPTSARARFMLAGIMLENRQYGEALPQLEAAVESDPDHKLARFNLAQVYRGMGRLEEALPHYARVRQLDPGIAQAGHGHAVTLLWLGRFEEAQKSLEQSRQSLPADLDLTVLYSRFLGAMPSDALRDGDEALKLAVEVFRRWPTLSVAETIAMAHAEIGRFDQAIAWQEAARASAALSGRKQLVQHTEIRLDMYRRADPCREPWLRGEVHSPLPVAQPTP